MRFSRLSGLALCTLALCMGGAMAQQSAPPPPPPAADTSGITPPTAANNHAPQAGDYPLLSKALNEQGQVLLQYTVKEDGTVGEVSVVKSSGYPRLDDASVEMVKNRWLYKPAMKDGKPIAVRTQAQVTWKLETPSLDLPQGTYFNVMRMKPDDFPADAKAQHAEGLVGMMIIIGEDGQVLKSTVLRSSGIPSLDAATANLVTTRWHFSPAMISGKPAKSAIGLLVVWSLEDGAKN